MMDKIFREIITPVAQGVMLGLAFITLVSIAAISLAMGACEGDNNGKPCTITITVKPTPD